MVVGIALFSFNAASVGSQLQLQHQVQSKTHVLIRLTAAVFSAIGLAATIACSSFRAHPVNEPASAVVSADWSSSPCANALTQQAVCEAAGRRALEIMTSPRLEAITVVQDVNTGALVAFAASEPAKLDVTTAVIPLSVSKVFLFASWFDNQQPDATFESSKGNAKASNPAFKSRVSAHEMIVGGSDSAGREMAIALRKAAGTQKVLEDFNRYGFGRQADSARDESFWSELSGIWKDRLVPGHASVSLTADSKDTEWADTLSLGEINMRVTALHVSRFMQAVGNGGVMLPAVARQEGPASVSKAIPAAKSQSSSSNRVMQEDTARRLQSAMRDTVQRGTAASVARSLAGTGWQMGGKTGTGPITIGPESDGWFAGLIFDPQGKARFTVATFVRHGGRGGGNAARVSAELARYIIGK